MNYYKIIEDGYIVSVIKSYYVNKGIKITEQEYNQILSKLKNVQQQNGCICKLTYNLNWDYIEADDTGETTHNADIIERVNKLEEQSKNNTNDIIGLREGLNMLNSLLKTFRQIKGE